MSTWLNHREVIKSIQQGYLTATFDWYGGFTGLLQCLCLWFVSALYAWDDTSSQNLIIALPFFLGFGAVSVYAVYSLITERNLTLVETRISAAANQRLLLSVFKRLDWSVSQSTQQIVIAGIAKKWFGGAVFAIVLITDNRIYLNIANESNTKGRYTFSFGRNKQKLRLLIEAINKSILEIN